MSSNCDVKSGLNLANFSPSPKSVDRDLLITILLFLYIAVVLIDAVVKLGITVNLGILGYLKIDRVISRFPVPVSQMVHRLDWKQFSIKTKSF